LKKNHDEKINMYVSNEFWLLWWPHRNLFSSFKTCRFVLLNFVESNQNYQENYNVSFFFIKKSIQI
jgi:hypothetical protein